VVRNPNACHFAGCCVIAASLGLGLASRAFADDSLTSLLSATPASNAVDSISLVRRLELQRIAQTVGAQAGLADRSQEILDELKRNAYDLDQKWRFTDLILASGVLPPVITTIRDTADVTSTTMVVQGAVYHIVEPARFVSVPPSWRDWLFTGLNPVKPKLSDYQSSLPRNGKERDYWKEQVAQAYKAGRLQADEIFKLNVARLSRAYTGMRMFYELLAAGRVTAPEVASSTQSVVSKDPSVVVVGQTIFRITAGASFSKESQWKPLAP
jgi:defect-in-organelle-trafficking protein DotC